MYLLFSCTQLNHLTLNYIFASSSEAAAKHHLS